MIKTQSVDGIEHVLVQFGNGTVIVSSGYPYEVCKGKETDLILSESKEPHPIGDDSQEIEEASCTTELTKPIILRFTKSESVDVVMGVLQKIRDNLIALEGANDPH
jgi:hypothetical protein